jgi:hypothetical protein
MGSSFAEMSIARSVKAISPIVVILHCKEIGKMIDEQGTSIALTTTTKCALVSALYKMQFPCSEAGLQAGSCYR